MEQDIVNRKSALKTTGAPIGCDVIFCIEVSSSYYYVWRLFYVGFIHSYERHAFHAARQFSHETIDGAFTLRMLTYVVISLFYTLSANAFSVNSQNGDKLKVGINHLASLY